MLPLLALVLTSVPASAYRGRATIDVDNALRSTVTVWVDGEAVGTVGPYAREGFDVRPGARVVELVQRNRNCVLTEDLVHLPRRSEVTYEVDESCGPRPVYFVPTRPRPGSSIAWRPPAFRVVRHRGPVGEPVVVDEPRVRRRVASVSPRTR